MVGEKEQKARSNGGAEAAEKKMKWGTDGLFTAAVKIYTAR